MMMLVWTKMLLMMTGFSVQQNPQRVIANFCDKNIVFLQLCKNGKFLALRKQALRNLSESKFSETSPKASSPKEGSTKESRLCRKLSEVG